MTDKQPHDPDAILLHTRVERLEQEKTAAAGREEQYKKAQVKYNGRIAVFTGLLVICSLITGGVAIWQAHIANIAAGAAKSAADTARDALHVSERAYIADAAPELGVKSITLTFLNTGHIPSGKGYIVAHEATINTATPAATVDLRDSVERHWGAYKIQSIFPGTNSQKLAIPVPQLSEDRLNVGLQQIMVAGFLEYSDGFPDTPQQTLGFCQHTVYQTVMKRMFITPCDPQEMIPRLAALDGYPNNPEP